MRNVYLFQVSDSFSSDTKNAYLPYAIGTLAAKAWSNPKIKNSLLMKPIVFIRKKPEQVLEAMETPYVAAFSNYVWNFEYNLYMARLIKEKFPQCHIVFGGHNIARKDCLLEKHSCIDTLIFGEGEEIFEQLLLCLIGDGELSAVPNISYRSGGGIISTGVKTICSTDYPSPYTAGIFDSIMKLYPDYSFSAILETNRGCPYHCAYCDWGPMNTKVRLFPMSRIQDDIRWFSENKIDYIWGADANFGIFERDREIAQLIIEAKKQTGYPKQIKVNYAKKNGDTVFWLTKQFAQNGLSKSTTLSMQTLSETSLDIIGRKNMSTDDFSGLLKLYRRNSIPTYTEMILGLPGETKESFMRGIGKLIADGQHSVIEVYDCIVLPNASLAENEYIDKYQIRTVHLPYVQQHACATDYEITEYDDIVISTSTMTAAQRNSCKYFSVVVQCFHCMGFLRSLAVFANRKKGIAYRDFYSALSEWLLECDTKISEIFISIKEKIDSITHGVNSQYIYNKSYGDVLWPLDEAAYIYLIQNIDAFFELVAEFYNRFGIEPEIQKELIKYQKSIIRTPKVASDEISFSFDFFSYFEGLYDGKDLDIRKLPVAVKAKQLKAYDSICNFAREIVWYGRRNNRTILTRDSFDFADKP